MSDRRRRRPHPARFERRIAGVASAVCGVGMVTSFSVAAQAQQAETEVRTEAANQAPVTAPRPYPSLTSTTSLPPLHLDGGPSTVTSTTTTLAPETTTAPTTTVRRFIPTAPPTQPEETAPPEQPTTTSVATTRPATTSRPPTPTVGLPTTTISTTTTTIESPTTTSDGS